tara:strand:- start:215 stop:433 length:219 start_codon:yes stop_codon:yes gene_type:complete
LIISFIEVILSSTLEKRLIVSSLESTLCSKIAPKSNKSLDFSLIIKASSLSLATDLISSIFSFQFSKLVNED